MYLCSQPTLRLTSAVGREIATVHGFVIAFALVILDRSLKRLALFGMEPGPLWDGFSSGSCLDWRTQRLMLQPF